MPLPTMTVKNAAGIDTPIHTISSGRQAADDSQSVVIADEDSAALIATATAAGALNGKLPAAANITDAEDPSPVSRIGARLTGFNGLVWERLRSLAGQLLAITAFNSDAIMAGAALVAPKYAVINAASSGDNVLVSGVPGRKIRVLSYTLVASGFVDARFDSGSAPITGAMPLPTNGGVSCAMSPFGHFETAAGQPLELNLSAAVGVRGHLVYIEV